MQLPDAASLTKPFAEPHGIQIWLVLLQRDKGLSWSRFWGCKLSETTSGHLTLKRDLLAKSQIVLSLWEAGEWHSEQGRNSRRLSWLESEPESGSGIVWIGCHCCCHPCCHPWHSCHCHSCCSFYFKRPLRFCVTCCRFNQSPSDNSRAYSLKSLWVYSPMHHH